MRAKNTTADILRELRESKKMSRKQVAELVRKSEKTIDAWENARSQPDIETFFILCQLYEVDDIEKTFCVSEEAISAEQERHEQRLIEAYRANPDMQKAVDRLLKIEKMY